MSINKFDIAKALRNAAKTVSDANSYTLIGEGVIYSPDPNDTFVQEFVLYGDDNPLGVADNSSDIQIGIYQLNINVPKNQSKWVALEIIGVFDTAFPKGLELTFNSQMLRVKASSLSPQLENETHLIDILSVTFSVIA